jgi:hypothetical protein
LRRFWSSFLCVLALAACTIEPTPQQYIDRQAGSVEQVAASESELTRRLLSMADALERRDIEEVRSALDAYPDAFVFGPPPQSSVAPARVGYVLDGMVMGGRLIPSEVSVSVGPQNDIAWFRAIYTDTTALPADRGFRFSGTFRRIEGEWRLIQGHISGLNVPARDTDFTPPADTMREVE